MNDRQSRPWRNKEEMAEVARRSVSAVVTDAQWKWLLQKAAENGRSQAACLRGLIELAMRAARFRVGDVVEAVAGGGDVADACHEMRLQHDNVRAVLRDVAGVFGGAVRPDPEH